VAVVVDLLLLLLEWCKEEGPAIQVYNHGSVLGIDECDPIVLAGWGGHRGTGILVSKGAM